MTTKRALDLATAFGWIVLRVDAEWILLVRGMERARVCPERRMVETTIYHPRYERVTTMRRKCRSNEEVQKVLETPRAHLGHGFTKFAIERG